jgi:hypothetical protein
VLSAGGRIVNSGTIEGGNGGVAGATVAAGGAGIVLASGGQILNFGTVAGGEGAGGGGLGSAGIVLDGGSLSNGSRRDNTASVSGIGAGILAGTSPRASIYVRNFGVIAATHKDGTGIALDDNFKNTVVNFGTITGGDGTAISFGGGNDVLIVEPGAVFHGVVDVGGGANRIEFEKAGAIRLSIQDFGASSTNELVFSDRGFKLGIAGATSSPKPLPPSLFTADSTGKFTTTS